MQNESKSPGKPSLTSRVLGAVFPYKKSAQAAFRPAADGLEITRDMLDKIKADMHPTPRHAAPATFADARALWQESATRHSLDAQKIATIQTSLDYSWLAIFIAGVVAFAVGLAGVILIALGEVFTGAGFAGGLLPAILATGLMLRINIRRSQVRARALVSWPQFLHAAGGILPAIFADVRLSATTVDKE